MILLLILMIARVPLLQKNWELKPGARTILIIQMLQPGILFMLKNALQCREPLTGLRQTCVQSELTMQIVRMLPAPDDLNPLRLLKVVIPYIPIRKQATVSLSKLMHCYSRAQRWLISRPAECLKKTCAVIFSVRSYTFMTVPRGPCLQKQHKPGLMSLQDVNFSCLKEPKTDEFCWNRPGRVHWFPLVRMKRGVR